MANLPTEFPQPPKFYFSSEVMHQEVERINQCRAYMRLFNRPEAEERYRILADQIKEHIPTMKAIEDNLWAYYQIDADQPLPIPIVDFASRSIENLGKVTDKLALMYQKTKSDRKTRRG